jgi:hypothetical protein
MGRHIFRLQEDDPVDWDKIQSKDNHSIEELTYEEQQMLKEYERQQSEEELYMREFPNKDASPYK